MAHPAFAAGLAAIDAVFAEPVGYTGAGLAGATIQAVRSDIPADDFAGFNGKQRRVSFEVAKDALPLRPAKGDVVDDGPTAWQVIDVDDRDEIGRWRLWVAKQ